MTLCGRITPYRYTSIGTVENNYNRASIQEWNWHTSTGQVVSDEQQWSVRAAAAKQAESELQSCLDNAASIINTNYFGTDCPEGASLFDNLSKSIRR